MGVVIRTARKNKTGRLNGIGNSSLEGKNSLPFMTNKRVLFSESWMALLYTANPHAEKCQPDSQTYNLYLFIETLSPAIQLLISYTITIIN